MPAKNNPLELIYQTKAQTPKKQNPGKESLTGNTNYPAYRVTQRKQNDSIQKEYEYKHQSEML